MRVGLGYLPDVQFAPFYAAAVEGYYAEEGLEVEFQHGFVTELYPLLAQGQLDFVVGDAEDVIALRAADEAATPFTYIMAMYQRVPSALFALGEGELNLTDLAGKTVGMPGLFGSSYTSLQAVLAAAGLSEADIEIEEIGFTQLEAVLSGRVDMAMGFINNEPLLLQNQGQDVAVLVAGDYSPSVGNGVITTDELIAESPELAARFVRASQRGLALVLSDPELAFAAAEVYVDTLSEDRLEILLTSSQLYTSAATKAGGLGAFDPDSFAGTLSLLQASERVETELEAEAFYSLEFIDSTIKTD